MASLELCLITPPQKLFNEDWRDSTRSAVREHQVKDRRGKHHQAVPFLTVRTSGGLFGTVEV